MINIVYLPKSSNMPTNIEFYDASWFIAIKNILEVLSYCATIAAVWVVLITIKQYKESVEKRSMDEKTKAAENSIEVLRIFSSQIIPKMEALDKLLQEEKEKLLKAKNDGIINEQQYSAMLVHIKLDSGMGGIFNDLEQASVYIACGLTDEEIVFPPLNNVVIGYIQRNSDAFLHLTTQAPYKHINQVHDNWCKKCNELQEKETKK